ncbi:MAG TPA: ABC transporter permease, partial [Chitinophagaceae bacterium]|nr:ABC transporter permease [Chitinophagaceae bacterium]
RRFAAILTTSLKMALQELLKNKLRTFLSLFGITIGIFCIIGVLATVNSLEHNIQSEIKSLGSNTIFIDKWDYSQQGPDYPWWKYVNRPNPSHEDLMAIRQRSSTARYAALVLQARDNVEFGGSVLSEVRVYGITPEFFGAQPVEIAYGRLLSESDYERGFPAAIMGNEIAEKLFGEPDRAVGRSVRFRGKEVTVVGVIRKQGKQMIGGWEFDVSLLLPYHYARSLMDERRSDPIIVVKAEEGLSSKLLKDELTGAMRAIRKLSPTQEDNFSLNDINDFSDAMGQAFVSINIGGWAIAALSLIVGMFGVANIMFVTVKERTSQIGLKKAIGAKSSTILTEFLLESMFLCIIGGAIGLLLVFAGAQFVTHVLDFPIFLSPGILILAVVICLIVGVLAGIIPAYRAAKLDAVVAIRSK